MAIEYCRVTVHTRSKGHSAVEAAAYRSETALRDLRTGLLHNYENRKMEVESFIMLPEKADPRFLDREYLWNEVERAEKRSDAQVAKDTVIALPVELSREQQIEIARNFADDYFVSKGLVADVSIHFSKENPHAHILVTTRRLLGNQFDCYKARDLNPLFACSRVIINEELGKRWREYQEEYFEKNHLKIRVDQNRILSEFHEGRNVNSEAYYLHKQNEERAEQSRQIALNNPELFLHTLAGRSTVFTMQDIENLAYKSTNTLEEYHKAVEQALCAETIVHLGTGPDGIERFSTRYAIHQEYKLDRSISSISERNSLGISEKKAEALIQDKGLSEEQQKALIHIASGNNIAAVVGNPGTGKTYMLNTAREVWEKYNLNVYGATVSGIASENLKSEAKINSMTIASWQRLFSSGFSFTNKDVLVVDEAGMVNLYQMKSLTEQIEKAKAKIVLVGDPKQLNPIGPGAPFRLITEKFGYSEMSEIRRQRVDWMREASHILSKGDVNGIDVYREKGHLSISRTPEEAKELLISQWAENIDRDKIFNSVIIAHRNSDINELNLMARNALLNKGIIKKTASEIISDKGRLLITQGDKILFTRNDRELGVMNGNFAEVLSINGKRMDVKLLSESRIITVDLNKYNNISYGYAATVHKLQGVTVEKSYVYYGGKYWNRNLNLVALTRHKDDLRIYADEKTHKTYELLKSRLNRSEYKDSVLNYPVAFSLRYGVDPDSVIGKAINKLNEVKEKVHDGWLWLLNRQSYLERHPEVEPKDNNLSIRIDDTVNKLLKDYADTLSHIEKMEDLKTKSQGDTQKVSILDDTIKALRENEYLLGLKIYGQKEFVAALRKCTDSKEFSLGVSELGKAIKGNSLTHEQASGLFNRISNSINYRPEGREVSKEISLDKGLGLN